jgi:hypothetical protein
MDTGARPPREELPTASGLLICIVCGNAIAEASDARILRDAYALPEEPETFVVDACCVAPFVARHSGRWDVFPLCSRDAAWLVPMRFRAPRA